MGYTAGFCKLSSSTFAEDRSIIRAGSCPSTLGQAPFRSAAKIVFCFLLAATIGDFCSTDGTRHTCFTAVDMQRFLIHPFHCVHMHVT